MVLVIIFLFLIDLSVFKHDCFVLTLFRENMN